MKRALLQTKIGHRISRKMRYSFSLLAGLISLLWGTRVYALPDESWLIVVGNNRGDADEIQLLYGERDAREFAEVLRTQGNIASDRVRILIDESAETVRRERWDLLRCV